MPKTPSAILRRLGKVRATYGSGAAREKRVLLESLERARLGTAREVLALHETLCFLRAFPDDRGLLSLVERMLARFASRADLARHRRALADSGIAGTVITYPCYQAMASWLTRRWPDSITIDWPSFENSERLRTLLPLLLPYSESPGLDELDFPTRGWIEELKGPGETDAAFLVRRFERLAGDEFGREAAYDDLDLPLRIAPGPGTPSRTDAHHPDLPVVFQDRPLSRERPDLRAAALRPPLETIPVSPREGRRLIGIARASMVTRSRDLDAFANADERDVRMVDAGEGLQFACFGARPERRLLLESILGFQTYKNGVPIGYVLASGLFGSSGVAYNIFESFRGAESALIYGRILGMLRHLFLCDAFSVDPYQLGHGNSEGLHSGAFWFYHKLGFRPRDPGVLKVLGGELRRMRARPAHRSSLATLERLTAEHVFLFLGRPRRAVLGSIDVGAIGLRISRELARRFGAERERGLETCARETAERLGLGGIRELGAVERLWWRRLSPLITLLPGVEDWTKEEKTDAIEVIRAKAGRHESDFVPLFDRHRRLREGVLRLART